ncbi:MAG: KpsF/GutQ family sugar-phosphate isomerase [Syntrophaceae bacterium]
MNTEAIITLGQEVIETEIEGLSGLSTQLNETFARAVEAIVVLKGKVVLSGVGKSGIIGRKIAATMVSLGIPAMFLHPVDGMHGDLGVISADDIAVILSNSGTTKELSDLIPALKRLGIRIIMITGNPETHLAQEADLVLACHVAREACNLGLAPTASTTAQLALGDALAVVVSRLKGFDREDFKVLHPAGELGKQLMCRIDQIMISGERLPFVSPADNLETVLAEMTAKKLGITLVGGHEHIEGIVTDGDLRRALLKHKGAVQNLSAREIMTPAPKTIPGNMLAIDALDIMERHQITSLIVLDEATQAFAGVVHLHDLLGRGNLALKGL